MLNRKFYLKESIILGRGRKFYSLKKENIEIKHRVELMYRDSGNMHFSFFLMHFFHPTLKIKIQKTVSVS